jgi:hypothetical protein
MFGIGGSEMGILGYLFITALLAIFITWRVWSIGNEVKETNKRLSKLIELQGGGSLAKTGKEVPCCTVCGKVNTDNDVWCIACGTEFNPQPQSPNQLQSSHSALA